MKIGSKVGEGEEGGGGRSFLEGEAGKIVGETVEENF